MCGKHVAGNWDINGLGRSFSSRSASSDWASECREKAPNTEILSRMAIYNFRVWNFLIKYLNGKNKNENNATLKKQKQTSDKGNWNNCFDRNSHFLLLFSLPAREKKSSRETVMTHGRRRRPRCKSMQIPCRQLKVSTEAANQKEIAENTN